MRIPRGSLHIPHPPLLLFVLLALLSRCPSPVLAQSQAAQLNKITSFSISSAQKTLSIALPQTSQTVVLSIALCNEVDGVPLPSFFVSTKGGPQASSSASRSVSTSSVSASGTLSLPDDSLDQVEFTQGVGLWNDQQTLDVGGTLRVTTDSNARTGTWRFQVGVSTDTFLHGVSNALPLYGDSTSTSAILFSNPILVTASPFQEPSYPRYTLPDANLTAPTPPDAARTGNSTLVVVPTSSLQAADGSSKSTLMGSSCFLQSLAATSAIGGVGSTSKLVLRDQSQGWRTEYVVNGLKPATNYTFYTLSAQGSGVDVSLPAYFQTKSATFACSLVHDLPFCPQVAWAAPFPPLATNPSIYDGTNFPGALQQIFLQSLGNFTASLTTFACGRDIYSIAQSCASCERAYRNWLCSMLIPRCGEPPSTPVNPPPALVPRSLGTANTTSTFSRIDQTVFGAGNAVKDYTELLPCLETCNAVDRACPANLQWTCPRKGFNAERSYGVGYVDRAGDDVSGGGVERGGSPGVSQDKYGNVWCNGANG